MFEFDSVMFGEKSKGYFYDCFEASSKEDAIKQGREELNKRIEWDYYGSVSNIKIKEVFEFLK